MAQEPGQPVARRAFQAGNKFYMQGDSTSACLLAQSTFDNLPQYSQRSAAHRRKRANKTLSSLGNPKLFFRKPAIYNGAHVAVAAANRIGESLMGKGHLTETAIMTASAASWNKVMLTHRAWDRGQSRNRAQNQSGTLFGFPGVRSPVVRA